MQAGLAPSIVSAAPSSLRQKPEKLARAREVKCAVDLLRLTLAYCLGSMGLRLTAAWAEASGLAILSNVALLQRLRNMVAWLEVLVARLLSSSNGGPRVAAANGRPIRIVDATVVSKAGGDKSG